MYFLVAMIVVVFGIFIFIIVKDIIKSSEKKNKKELKLNKYRYINHK
ncbi:MAG: hypothetical protein IKP65_02400 [Alphaproteobacteria bacterium]|nr:hypothetical protein [Alphaproteobacteria bacterium]